MYKYTLGFIKRNNQLLMLNREKPFWMGNWNGVGGRIEEGETPTECMIRETYEETGIIVNDVNSKGTVIWSNDDGTIGGMYIFLIDMPINQELNGPVKVTEGILDWKDIDWIFNKDNLGIVPNIPFFLNYVLESNEEFEHKLIYKNNDLVEVKSNKLDHFNNS